MTDSDTDSRQACPCGSGQTYPACCGAYHNRQRLPVTAEALMRSRYSAYVLQDWNYLINSWHPSTRPDLNSLQESEAIRWAGLEIMQTRVGMDPNEAFVEFRAHYRDGEQLMALHENSRFSRDQGCWQYVDGQVGPATAIPAGKTGRNEPCPCGSGRKFKRCCGR